MGIVDSFFRVYDPSELGADGYPREWHATIKYEVRERAGYRCARCQHPYRNGEHGSGEWSPCDEVCSHLGPVRSRRYTDEWSEAPPTLHPGEVPGLVNDGYEVEARWRILTVHHLDGDKANCRWWNLVALCQRCHLQIQGKVLMEQIYPFEHTAWFQPYAAGYYAWKYRGLDLSRNETLARLDDLLALERAA